MPTPEQIWEAACEAMRGAILAEFQHKTYLPPVITDIPTLVKPPAMPPEFRDADPNAVARVTLRLLIGLARVAPDAIAPDRTWDELATDAAVAEAFITEHLP
jgi:hypothetical protein